MSASPIARQATQSQSIPSKRIVIHDPNQLPADYSSTPGGTLYSTTPGGTRIVYERAFLMNLRNSPISRTPPRNTLTIPPELLKDALVIEESAEQFEMDM
ncbi:eukaryotic translation initiation factor 4E-binding protein isoform X2 [Linepithema humile]|uniref:eukaryotic translation initiation factor 4E-binding protein isoform X2 n=1 Tax=Linepithema humile TaxID=83485 RepID=UPI00062364DD|nr:PREDICTED: eukaryotic translation initiation factor 4E-binding protein 1 isoform X2 [Linepithema humile]